MPELPEVETTRIGIAPYIIGECVSNILIRESRLRWPISRKLNKQLTGQTIRKLERRAKYLLFHTEHGCMILHLGMSGSLRVVNKNDPPEKHDHVDIVLSSGCCLRLRDPRRFGSIHWTRDDPYKHCLLRSLGPEPLSNEFNGDYLFNKSRRRQVTVKNFIMNGHIVVGIGNIYSSESLFNSGIHPKRKAGSISKNRYDKLAKSIKEILSSALSMGGTTLRDFVKGDGRPGYFQQKLQVYDQNGKPCPNCGSVIKKIIIGQRSAFFCSKCQH